MGRKRLRTNYKRPRSKSQQRDYYTKTDIFISRMASILLKPKGEVKHLFYQKARSTIRLNNLKGDPKKIYKLLTHSKGWKLQEIKNIDYTYFINNRDKKDIANTEEYEDGKFYIQDLSTILSINILNPQKKEEIVDLAATSASKAALISLLTKNEAYITINNEDAQRNSKYNNMLNQFGSQNVEIINKESVLLGKIYPNRYDRVILNAPSSDEGRIYLSGQKPLRSWSIKMVNAMVKKQKVLIESAFKTLKVGGTLVYSTCTLEPEENEGVVTHLLKKFPNARMESIHFVEELEPLLTDKITNGITKWSGNTYHQEVAKSVRIIPSPEMMGSYIAKITKT